RRRGAAEFFLEELANLGAETLGFRRQIVERESEDGRHGREWTTSRATAQRRRAAGHLDAGADPAGGGGGGAPPGGGGTCDAAAPLAGGGGAPADGRVGVGANADAGQRNTTAFMRSRSFAGNDSSAVSPPRRTTLRRRSLMELSSTVPSVVQPIGTFGSVVRRTRATAMRVASSARAADAVSTSSALASAILSAMDPPARSSGNCSP